MRRKGDRAKKVATPFWCALPAIVPYCRSPQVNNANHARQFPRNETPLEKTSETSRRPSSNAPQERQPVERTRPHGATGTNNGKDSLPLLMLCRPIDSVRVFDNRGYYAPLRKRIARILSNARGMVCVHSRPPHQGARRSLNCDSYPGHGSQARTFMRVRPPGGGGGPPAETLLLPRNRRPPRRRSCRPVLSSGLILPILRACARTGVKIRDPRRHIGQWWNVLHWNTLHRFPHMHACGTSQEIRRLTRITPHLTRAIQPRNLRQRRTAPNTPPRANTVHLSRVRADRSRLFNGLGRRFLSLARARGPISKFR